MCATQIPHLYTPDLAADSWGAILWRAMGMKPRVTKAEIYSIVELDTGFYTLTARLPTESMTGPMWRLETARKSIVFVETLQAIKQKIERRITAGERGPPEGFELWARAEDAAQADVERERLRSQRP